MRPAYILLIGVLFLAGCPPWGVVYETDMIDLYRLKADMIAENPSMDANFVNRKGAIVANSKIEASQLLIQFEPELGRTEASWSDVQENKQIYYVFRRPIDEKVDTLYVRKGASTVYFFDDDKASLKP